MSRKPFDYLLPTDQQLRRLFPVGMRSGVDVEIHLVCGFELFNTEPYHNYETWSNGYRAVIDGQVVAEAEDLDDLLDKLKEHVQAARHANL